MAASKRRQWRSGWKANFSFLLVELVELVEVDLEAGAGADVDLLAELAVEAGF